MVELNEANEFTDSGTKIFGLSEISGGVCILICLQTSSF